VLGGKFRDAHIVLSPDRKYLVLPEDGKVSVMDAVTGELMFVLPVPARRVAGVCMNQSGSKLAALTEQHVYVWDLASGNDQPQVYEAPLIGSPFKSRLEWIDDDLLLAEGHLERVVYRMSLQLPIWSYRMDLEQRFVNTNPLVNRVVHGLLFYVAVPDMHNGSIAIGAVKIPGPSVDEMTKEINWNSLMIMKSGTRVGIKTDSVTDASSIEQWLVADLGSRFWDSKGSKWSRRSLLAVTEIHMRTN
jgi:hypothetical protein